MTFENFLNKDIDENKLKLAVAETKQKFFKFMNAFAEMINENNNESSFYTFYRKFLETYVIEYSYQFNNYSWYAPVAFFDFSFLFNEQNKSLLSKILHCCGNNLFESENNTEFLLKKQTNFFSFCFLFQTFIYRDFFMKYDNKHEIFDTYNILIEYEWKYILLSLFINLKYWSDQNKQKIVSLYKKIEKFNKETFHLFCFILNNLDFERSKIDNIIKTDINIKNEQHIEYKPDFVIIFSFENKKYIKPVEITNTVINEAQIFNNKNGNLDSSHLQLIESIVRKFKNIDLGKYDDAIKSLIQKNKDKWSLNKDGYKLLKTDVLFCYYENHKDISNIKDNISTICKLLETLKSKYNTQNIEFSLKNKKIIDLDNVKKEILNTRDFCNVTTKTSIEKFDEMINRTDGDKIFVYIDFIK